MNLYRGIVYSLEGNHIKLFNKAGLERGQDAQGRLSTFTNGEAYVSLPDDLEVSVHKYVKRVINRLYSRMEYYKKEEIRGKIY
jgi:hypothetical protein